MPRWTANTHTDSNTSSKPNAYTFSKPDTYTDCNANAVPHAHAAFSADPEISSDPAPEAVRLG